jgi:hypothetical protein
MGKRGKNSRFYAIIYFIDYKVNRKLAASAISIGVFLEATLS